MSKWVCTTLGEIVSSGGGKIQTGPFGSQLHAADYVEVGIPCIMPANMKNNRVDLTDIKSISENDAKRLSQHLVKAGDIVYSRRGDITQKALIRKTEAGYFCGTGCLLIRPGANIDPEFLTYHLSAPSNISWIINQAVGATMPNLNTSILSKAPLSVPNKTTQQKIAAVLSAFDAKIELNNHINAELEAMAKTLYNYWFVQFDFPDKNGKPYKSSGGKMVWNKELKREIPAGWDSVTINQLLTKESATNKISSSDILLEGSIPIIDQSTDYIAGYTNDESSRIKCEVPRIIFGDHTRILKLINFDFARGADGTQTMLSNSVRMPQCLFYHTMLKIDLSNYGYARHYKFLKDQRIILPDESIAQKYNGLAHTYYELIRQNIFENQHLSSLRDWLLPML
ncbi:MAG: restriction endonuclease subunit S, partial [Pelobacteraceae bacterium]